MSKEINESEILDEIITDLRQQLKTIGLDFDERMKLNDRLMKALAQRSRLRTSKKGKGFNLG